MSPEHVAVARRIYDAIERSGEPEWSLLDEAVEIYDHDAPDLDVFHGHDGWRRWWGDWASAWEQWHTRFEEIVDAGDRVVVIFRMTVRAKNGPQVDRQDAMVFTVHDDKAVRVDYYNSRERALAAAAGTP